MKFEPEFVHKVIRKKKLDEFSTAVNQDIWACWIFKLFDIGQVLKESMPGPPLLALTFLYARKTINLVIGCDFVS